MIGNQDQFWSDKVAAKPTQFFRHLLSQPRCLKPLFQTIIALGDTDHAKMVSAANPLLSKHNFMGDQRLAEIGVHRCVGHRLRRKKGHKWP
jgi:hypothetical protein